MSWPTIRRFERTSAAAFRDASYASAIERPAQQQHRWADRICWIVVAALLLYFAAVYLKHGAGPLS